MAIQSAELSSSCAAVVRNSSDPVKNLSGVSSHGWALRVTPATPASTTGFISGDMYGAVQVGNVVGDIEEMALTGKHGLVFGCLSLVFGRWSLVVGR